MFVDFGWFHRFCCAGATTSGIPRLLTTPGLNLILPCRTNFVRKDSGDGLSGHRDGRARWRGRMGDRIRTRSKRGYIWQAGHRAGLTQLVEQRRPHPSSIRIPSFTAKKDGQSDFKKTGSFDASSKDKQSGPARKFEPRWQCGQLTGGKMCGKWNFYFATANKSNSAVADKCSDRSQLKKEASKSGYNKKSVNEPSFGAAAIERLIKDRVAIGLQKAIDAQKTSDESVMAAFAQADYSRDAFSLGLGGIVAESISSLHDDEPCFPEDGDAVIDQNGNNADAYLRQGTNYSEALAHQIATMSCIVMFLSGIHGFASSVTNRFGQACSSVMTWLVPEAGSRHATTAGMCILIACCVLFTQLASTQALRPSAYNQCHWSTACYRKLGHRVIAWQCYSIWAEAHSTGTPTILPAGSQRICKRTAIS